MIIVKIHGGLGNQMFQYAFYRNLLSLHPNVKMDIITSYSGTNTHNGYELNKIFKIFENYATPKEIRDLSNYGYADTNYILVNIKKFIKKRVLTGKELKYLKNLYLSKRHVNRKKRYENELNNVFIDKNTHIFENQDKADGKFIKRSNVYYEGYWNNIFYFENVLDILYDEFKFESINLKDRNKELYDMIQDANASSVSIHIRRGDYVGSPIHDILDISYYIKAINEIESICSNPKYFIFSDNPTWVRKNYSFLKNRDCVYVTHNKNENSYIDMQLMSYCMYNIIANSTFSWWAAFLNRNKDKLIISPTVFFILENKKINMPMFPSDVKVIEIN